MNPTPKQTDTNTPHPSRRSFLASSSAGIAGATLASATANANTATDSCAGWVGFGDAEIKVGLIGCGGRGSGAAANLMNTPGKIKIVAMGDAFRYRIDSSLEQLGKIAEKEGEKKEQAPGELLDVPEERQFVGLDAYKKVLESDCDLVVLATPPGFRPLHCEAAIDAGKHVFMEKPVATDAPGIRRVLAAGKKAAEKGLAVQVGLQRRHEDKYKQTIERLQDGAIGDILFTRVYWNSGGVWVRPRKSDQTEVQYQVDNWFYFNWLCGDHIVEQHIHNLDVSNWLNQGTPVEANGMGGRQIRTGKEFGQIFDHHMVEYTYENGSKMISQCRHQEGCWGSVGEHAHGAKGTANIGAGKIFGPDGKVIYRYKGRSVGGHQQEQTDFIAALRAGQLPNEVEYGALSTMTAIFGRMATYSGKALKWDDAINSELSLVPDDLTWDSEAPVTPDADGYYPVPVPGKTIVI